MTNVTLYQVLDLKLSDMMTGFALICNNLK